MALPGRQVPALPAPQVTPSSSGLFRDFCVRVSPFPPFRPRPSPFSPPPRVCLFCLKLQMQGKPPDIMGAGQARTLKGSWAGLQVKSYAWEESDTGLEKAAGRPLPNRGMCEGPRPAPPARRPAGGAAPSARGGRASPVPAASAASAGPGGAAGAVEMRHGSCSDPELFSARVCFSANKRGVLMPRRKKQNQSGLPKAQLIF